MTIRTEEEIREQIRLGEKFSTEHPRSFFGDDNVRTFNLDKMLMEKALEGEGEYTLYDRVEMLSDEENLRATDTIYWLFNEDAEYPPYSEE